MSPSTVWNAWSVGAKAGTAVGAACGALLAIAIITFLLLRRHRHNASLDPGAVETISNDSAGIGSEPPGQQLAEYELRKWRRSVGMTEDGHGEEL